MWSRLPVDKEIPHSILGGSNPYSYTNNEPRFALSLLQTTSRWRRYAVDLPAADNPVSGDTCHHLVMVSSNQEKNYPFSQVNF